VGGADGNVVLELGTNNGSSVDYLMTNDSGFPTSTATVNFKLGARTDGFQPCSFAAVLLVGRDSTSEEVAAQFQHENSALPNTEMIQGSITLDVAGGPVVLRVLGQQNCRLLIDDIELSFSP
jgi:hypothetical protein